MGQPIVQMVVTDQLNELMKSLDQCSPQEIEKITVETLNESAFEAVKTLKEEMQRVFDRPTNYTINALRIDYAKSGKLVSSVEYKDDVSKGGTPAKKFLGPEVEGGDRNQIGTERMLSQLLGTEIFLGPGPSAQLNSFGSVPSSKYRQVLSYFRLNRDEGVTSNRSFTKGARRSSKAKQFVIVPPGTANSQTMHLSPGIYERSGVSLRKIFNFISKPHYSKRFDFYGVGMRRVSEVFVKKFEMAVIKMMYKRQGKLTFAKQSSAPIQGPFES